MPRYLQDVEGMRVTTHRRVYIHNNNNVGVTNIMRQCTHLVEPLIERAIFFTATVRNSMVAWLILLFRK